MTNKDLWTAIGQLPEELIERTALPEQTPDLTSETVSPISQTKSGGRHLHLRMGAAVAALLIAANVGAVYGISRLAKQNEQSGAASSELSAELLNVQEPADYQICMKEYFAQKTGRDFDFGFSGLGMDIGEELEFCSEQCGDYLVNFRAVAGDYHQLFLFVDVQAEDPDLEWQYDVGELVKQDVPYPQFSCHFQKDGDASEQPEHYADPILLGSETDESGRRTAHYCITTERLSAFEMNNSLVGASVQLSFESVKMTSSLLVPPVQSKAYSLDFLSEPMDYPLTPALSLSDDGETVNSAAVTPFGIYFDAEGSAAFVSDVLTNVRENQCTLTATTKSGTEMQIPVEYFIEEDLDTAEGTATFGLLQYEVPIDLTAYSALTISGEIHGQNQTATILLDGTVPEDEVQTAADAAIPYTLWMQKLYTQKNGTPCEFDFSGMGMEIRQTLEFADYSLTMQAVGGDGVVFWFFYDIMPKEEGGTVPQPADIPIAFQLKAADGSGEVLFDSSLVYKGTLGQEGGNVQYCYAELSLGMISQSFADMDLELSSAEAEGTITIPAGSLKPAVLRKLGAEPVQLGMDDTDIDSFYYGAVTPLGIYLTKAEQGVELFGKWITIWHPSADQIQGELLFTDGTTLQYSQAGQFTDEDEQLTVFRYTPEDEWGETTDRCIYLPFQEPLELDKVQLVTVNGIQIPLAQTGYNDTDQTDEQQNPDALLLPDFTGMTRDAAIDWAHDQMDLMRLTYEYAYSADIPAGTVTAQDIPAGTPIEEGMQCVITVSAGDGTMQTEVHVVRYDLDKHWLVVEFLNGDLTELTYGTAFKLYDATGAEVPFRDQVAFPSVAMLVEPGVPREELYLLDNYFDEALQPGVYQFAVNYNGTEQRVGFAVP